MIEQYKILNYIKECFQRFEKDFLIGLEDLETEKEPIQNYSNLLHNLCHKYMIKYAPDVNAFLSNYESHEMDFQARATLVSMWPDYIKRCNNLILENVNK